MSGSWFKFYLIMQGTVIKNIINILLDTHHWQGTGKGMGHLHPSGLFPPIHKFINLWIHKFISSSVFEITF